MVTSWDCFLMKYVIFAFKEKWSYNNNLFFLPISGNYLLELYNDDWRMWYKIVSLIYASRLTCVYGSEKFLDLRLISMYDTQVVFEANRATTPSTNFNWINKMIDFIDTKRFYFFITAFMYSMKTKELYISLYTMWISGWSP